MPTGTPKAPSRPSHCAICDESSEVATIRSFSLIIAIKKGVGTYTTRGAGTINLCERCWRVKAARWGRRRKRT